MVDSPSLGNIDYSYVLAAFAKWCHIMHKAIFFQDQCPTMASLITVILSSGRVQVHCTPAGETANFAVSSSLPGPLGKFKNQAREVRQACLDKLFSKLPDAPRFAAATENRGQYKVNWGHCAETLSTIWLVVLFSAARDANTTHKSSAYMNVKPPNNMGGLAVLIQVVGEYSTYKEEIINKAEVKACENCKLLMNHANIVYNDWYKRGIFSAFSKISSSDSLW